MKQSLVFEETNKWYWPRFASVNITFRTPINPDIGLFKHQ